MNASTGGGRYQRADGAPQVVEGVTAIGRWSLDVARSRVEFRVKHLWHAVSVRGAFGRVQGEVTVAEQGGVTGEISIAAASVDTWNRPRDKHLRSADFLDADRHPVITFTLTDVRAVNPTSLDVEGLLEVAGRRSPLAFRAGVRDVSADEVTVVAEFRVDRTAFGMTWSPLRMASRQVTVHAVARFIRMGALSVG